MNDEGLSNEWQENTPMKQEINPWLHQRLEERARPLNSGVLAVDKHTLISPSYQQLLYSTSKSNHIVDSVVRRVGLISGIVQAKKLSLFSKTFPGIISRTVNTGASNLYKMMNLPWFGPKRGYKQESVNDSASITRKEMPEDITGDRNDTVILPGTESVKDNRHESLAKTPETYINYMISSPITRKTTMNINKQDQDSVPKSPSSLRISKGAETYDLIDIAGNNRELFRISRNIDRSAIKEVIPNIGIQPENRTTKTIGYPSHHREDKDKGQVTAIGEDIKKVETIDYPLPQREGKDTGQISASDVDTEKTETINYPSPRREDGGEGQILPTEIDVTTPDISLKSKGDKGNSVYPAKHLFYGSPSSIVRKIVQSLPFSRNIQRKEILPSESVNQPADSKQTEQSINYGQLNNSNNMSNPNESPRVMPVNSDLPVAPDVNRTGIKDSIIVQEFPDTRDGKQSYESQKQLESHIFRETDIKVGTSSAYPVKNLFYRKPLPLTQRLIQSLPFVRNIQRKHILSRESVNPSMNQTQSELNDNFQPLGNFQTEDRYEVDTKAYKAPQELPLISRSITSIRSESHQSGILSKNRDLAVPEFIMPVDNSIDLTLAPANRMPIEQRREEYSRIEQPPVAPAVTRSAQIRPAETQQTETSSETQPTETSEQAATGTQESSTNVNENPLDYRTIARETYPFIRRMIMVERERRPSR